MSEFLRINAAILDGDFPHIDDTIVKQTTERFAEMGQAGAGHQFLGFMEGDSSKREQAGIVAFDYTVEAEGIDDAINNTTESSRRGRFSRTTTGLLLTGGLILAACGGGNQDGSSLRASGSTISSPNSKKAANACAGNYDLTANLADNLFADRSSIFPSLDKKDGELLPTNKAAEAMQKQTGSDVRVAAVMSEVYNIRDNRKAPDTLTIPGFQSAVDTIKKNNDSVAKRVDYVCNQLGFVEPNKSNFAVVGGNATEISFKRDEKGVAGISFSTMPVDRVLSGFNLGANFDDAKLKPEDRKFFEQFMKYVIVTDDGKIVIRNLALNGGINVKDVVAETPVSPNQDHSNNKSGGGKGTFGNAKNKGESNQPGDVPESGGNAGSTPGTAPSFGPGTPTTTHPEGGTPTTTGPGTTTTTAPRTTTTTIPGTTTTTSTTTRPIVTTTTTTKKPPIDCNPVIDVC